MRQRVSGLKLENSTSMSNPCERIWARILRASERPRIVEEKRHLATTLFDNPEDLEGGAYGGSSRHRVKRSRSRQGHARRSVRAAQRGSASVAQEAAACGDPRDAEARAMRVAA